MHFTSKWERRNDGKNTATAGRGRAGKVGYAMFCTSLAHGVSLGAIPWMLPCNAKRLLMSNELDDHSLLLEPGGVWEGVKGRPGLGLRRRKAARNDSVSHWFWQQERENQEKRGEGAMALLDIKTGLFPPRLPNSCSFLDQISSPHFLRSPTRLGFVPNDPHQPTTKRRCLYALTGLSPEPTRTHYHKDHSHQIPDPILLDASSAPSSASYTSSCLPLISSSCVPSLSVLGVPLQKRKLEDQQIYDPHRIKDFFPALTQVFHDSPRLSLTTTNCHFRGHFFSLHSQIKATRTFSAHKGLFSTLCSLLLSVILLRVATGECCHHRTQDHKSPRNDCHCCATEF